MEVINVNSESGVCEAANKDLEIIDCREYSSWLRLRKENLLRTGKKKIKNEEGLTSFIFIANF